MKPSDTLAQAKALINTPEKWVRGSLATDGTYSRPVNAPEATCFCSLGAIQRVILHPPAGSFGVTFVTHMLILATIQEVVGCSLARFNDASTTTHANVMRAFDLTIEKLRSQGK